eukprot:scaffold937_cov81-Skeletonema_dohrnii-CCMP3373.AAC.1
MACVCHSHSVVSPSGKQSLSSQDSQRRLVKGYDVSSLVSPKEDYLDLVRKLNAHEHGEPKYILVKVTNPTFDVLSYLLSPVWSA